MTRRPDVSASPDVIPNAGLRTGHEQVAGYFESFGGAVEVAEFEPQKFFSQNDMVVVLGYYAREMKKPLVIYRELLYIPPTSPRWGDIDP